MKSFLPNILANLQLPVILVTLLVGIGAAVLFVLFSARAGLQQGTIQNIK